MSDLIMQVILNLMLITMTLVFSQLKHPLAMGFLLLIQTLIICMITGIIHESFWFSYILFLVFLGGMLVLFIYVTSLASNEMFNFSFKLTTLMFTLTFSMMCLSLMMDNMEFSFIMNNEFLSSTFNLPLKETCNSINKLYNFPTNLMTLVLINYLLFTLVVVVKITNFFFGPLRNLN